ncbi:MAG: WbuC family cupin fold metalloprotein [Bacteroidaceae bacterium]|nr:WbuC family cupin fold metalloprotein [Bacteroidaceae bacterium]
MVIDNILLDSLLEQAKSSPRLRQNFDLRTSTEDTSQRMLNALQPDTVVPIHRHTDTSETVICLCGRLEEIIYEEVVEYVREETSRTEEVLRKQTFKEVSRQLLCPAEGLYGIQIPKGAWHTIRVIEPSVIFEAKDGAFKQL